MNDDHLWDGAGPVDADVERLSRLLAPLRPGVIPPLRQTPQRRDERNAPSLVAVALAATLVLAIAGLLTSLHDRDVSRWRVAGVAGETTLDAGDWLQTSAAETARVAVADIGELRVEPNSRVRMLRSRPGDHRLEMRYGTVHATIWAPPGQFFVETPSSTAVDLGCAYTLTIDEEGGGRLLVTSGWVGFEWRGREAFIPAGAMALTRPGIGPGTPFLESAPAALRDALATVDFDTDQGRRQAALRQVLAAATAADVVTLWHLLDRVNVGDRPGVFDTLAGFAPPPAGVTRDGIVSGDRSMRDAWWDALGLGTAAWWRMWQQPWKDRR